MTRSAVLAASLLALVALACTSASGPPLSSASSASAGSGASQISSSGVASPSYHVRVNPADFSAAVDNPYFPLDPGTTLVYSGAKDKLPSRDVVHVTQKMKTILGVPCVVVQDVVYLGGRVEETTLDFYTQDEGGNVWYFGEDTQELNGKGQILNTDGSWQAGVGGAQPGIFMTASPEIGKPYRQEYLPGQAEDIFSTVSTTARVSVPYGSFSNTLLTKEWTPLEPNRVTHKYFVKGIGEVAEVSVKGPPEKLVLVDYNPA